MQRVGWKRYAALASLATTLWTAGCGTSRLGAPCPGIPARPAGIAEEWQHLPPKTRSWIREVMRTDCMIKAREGVESEACKLLLEQARAED